jgi:hypothetical protein
LLVVSVTRANADDREERKGIVNMLPPNSTHHERPRQIPPRLALKRSYRLTTVMTSSTRSLKTVIFGHSPQKFRMSFTPLH